MDFPSPMQLLNLDNPETIVTVLLRLADEMSTTEFYETLDIHAVGYGHLSQESLNKLLLQASGPDSLEYEEMTGTDVNLSVLHLLLDQGAEVNCRDAEGNSPLYRAVLHDREREAEFLLEHGAKVDDVFVSTNDPVGETCLTSAVQMDNLNMAKLLVRNGARIPADAVGRGLILFAAFHVRFEVLRLLVEDGGANVMETNDDGLSITDGLTELAAILEGGIGHFNDIWKDPEGAGSVGLDLDRNLNRLKDQVSRIVYFIQRGCPVPSPTLIGQAVQLEAYFVLLSLMFWCIEQEIPLQLPVELQDDFVANMQWDGMPLLKTGSAVLGELIRRVRGSSWNVASVLQLIDRNAGAMNTDYAVQNLKHICVENIRRRLISRHGAGALSVVCSGLAVAPSVCDLLTLEDLRLRFVKYLRTLDA